MRDQKEQILDEQDIINTYDGRQQEQCRLYKKYLEIKQQNPTYGYKRIAKLLGHSYGKTRWWHAKKHIPIPIQTANWLKEKKLIPLNTDNFLLLLIVKVLGATLVNTGEPLMWMQYTLPSLMLIVTVLLRSASRSESRKGAK